MIAKIRELRLTLRELGFEPRPGKGSYEIWVDTAAPRRRVALSGNDGDDAPRYQAKRVRRFRHGTMPLSIGRGKGTRVMAYRHR